MAGARSRCLPGGYREAAASIRGDDVYGSLKFENGVHRVSAVIYPCTIPVKLTLVARIPFLDRKQISRAYVRLERAVITR